jgi:N-acetylmuramoyl-L-alanine amidase
MDCSVRRIACLVGVILTVPVALADPASIRAMSLAASRDQTSLIVSLSDVSRYRMFNLPSPDRVVIDFESARLTASALPLPAGNGVIRQVRAANRPDGSVRIVLDLGTQVEPKGIMRGSPAGLHELVVNLISQPAVNGSSEQQPSASVARVAPVNKTWLAIDPAGPLAAHDLAEPDARDSVRINESDRAELPKPPCSSAAASASTPPVRCAAQVAPRPTGRDIVIAIDAGHGGKDPGARGPRGVLEKDVTLRIARQLADAISVERGMRGVLTRKRDEFIPLRGRMERARAAQADLFISIHADAVRNRAVQGASVYVLNEKGATDEAARRLADRENAADLIGGVSLGDKDRTLASVLLDLSQNASLSSSIEVADEILEEMARVGTVRRMQVMQAPFMVLKSPDVPSVLIETAYISNATEERRLNSDEYRRQLAAAILAGARNYFYENPPAGTLVAELSRQRLADTVQHVIRRGETLSMLAIRYGTSVQRIRTANRLTDDRVAVGQVLHIPVIRET